MRLVIACCALLLAGCSSDTAADTQPAATATPIPTPVVLLPEPSAPPVVESIEPDSSAAPTAAASIVFDRNGSPIYVFKRESMPDPDGVNIEINADPDTQYFIAELRRNFIDGSWDPLIDPSWFEKTFGTTPDERAQSLFDGGLRIFTTYDPDTQGRATQARDEVVPLAASPGDGEGTITMAAVSIDPRSGAVRALVGGQGVDQIEFNVTIQDERRLGSAFDPFVLVTALEYGFVPLDRISGSGPCQSITEPQVVVSDPGNDLDRITLIEHTTYGSRCASLRLGEFVGIPRVIDAANRLGLDLDTELDNLPRLAAGIADARPFDVATAYATIANGGIYNEPYFIERVENSSGARLFQREPNARRALDRQSACLATEVLESAALRASGFVTQIRGQRVAGHFGTTEATTDLWFAGFIPELATVVWMGDSESLNATPVAGGSSLPAQAWGHIMQGYQTDLAAPQPSPCEPVRRWRFVTITDGG